MAPLVRRATADRAFERLYRRHVQNVYRYSLAVLGEPADAEDVTQTTFLNAYRAFQRGERPEKPENWLIAIAHNVCRQRFRQQQRRPQEVEFVDDVVGGRERSNDAPTVDELRRAFAALPANYRAALVMRELKGASYSEIAATLGITLPALEALIFRARAALREHLEERLSCSETGLAISKQMDGELVPAQQRALRAHLRECPACARLARSQRAQRKTLRSLLLVPLPLSLKTFLPGSTDAAAAIAGGGGAAAIGSSATFGGSAAGGAALAVKAATVLAVGALVGGGGYEGITHAEPFLTPGPQVPARHGHVRSARSHSERGTRKDVAHHEPGNLHAVPRRAHATRKTKHRGVTHPAQAAQGRVSERHPTASRVPSAHQTHPLHAASTGHARPLPRPGR